MRPTDETAKAIPTWGRRRFARLTATQGGSEPAPASAPAPGPGTGAAPLPGEGGSPASFLGARAAAMDSTSVQIAFGFCAAVTILFVLSSEDFIHWFIIPVYLCGVVAAVDAVDWVRGRVGVVDPGGILGLLGVHFFFLAPLLHVAWDWWLPFVVHPPEWRPWLGYMAALNLVSLLAYRVVRDGVGWRGDGGATAAPRGSARTYWQVSPVRIVPLLAGGMFVSAVLQAWVYARFGGLGGYVAAYQDRMQLESFKGMGAVFMLAEMFPILAAFSFALYARATGKASDWLSIVVVLGMLFVLKIFFGGLRGSRANYIWPMFWAVGIIHLWVRPIPRRLMGIGLGLVVLFMYVYGVYKHYGVEAAGALDGPESISEMASDAKRGMDATILGDLGRSDTQAYVLRELASDEGRGDFTYAWGRTYLGAAVLLVPSSVWPDRPAAKSREGTEILYGKGTWDTRHWVASNAFGLAGETMLNFGPLAVPLAYAGLGWVVGRVRRWMQGLRPFDSRLLLAQFLVSFVIYLLVWDSDVIVFYVITSGVAPAAVVFAGSVVRRVEGAHGADWQAAGRAE